MSIDGSKIKELKEKTNAGIMDCKNALVEANGDMEEAVQILRKRGLASASKKSGRNTSEGAIGIAVKDGTQAVIVETNTETDFVARNEKFHALVTNILEAALQSQNLEDLNQTKLSSGNNIEEEINRAISIFGENIKLQRVASLKVKEGVISTHIHQKLSDNLTHIGNSGVIVSIGTKATGPALEELGKHIAMHITGYEPIVVSIADLDPQLIEKEKATLLEQAKVNNTQPEAIINKIVEGRLRKFYEEVVLLEQNFILDNNKKVKDIIKDFEQKSGHSIRIADFIRYQVGSSNLS